MLIAVRRTFPVAVGGFEADVFPVVLRSPHGVFVFAADDVFGVKLINRRVHRCAVIFALRAATGNDRHGVGIRTAELDIEKRHADG